MVMRVARDDTSRHWARSMNTLWARCQAINWHFHVLILFWCFSVVVTKGFVLESVFVCNVILQEFNDLMTESLNVLG